MNRKTINVRKGFLQEGFNKKKLRPFFPLTHDNYYRTVQSTAKNQCLGKMPWPEISHIKGWLVSAETATFMKWGGLGMVASELPENFNKVFLKDGHQMQILTPMYLGDTGKKKAFLKDGVYEGAENRALKVQKVDSFEVMFLNETGVLEAYPVYVYQGVFNGVDYYFLQNERFFSINPHKNNPSTQDGCYILNKYGINEVERFAFFSKAVYHFIIRALSHELKGICPPNIIISNDWHSGALSGLCKYGSLALVQNHKIDEAVAAQVRNIPIIHIAHHLGYQGWDYENTAKILNSLYEEMSAEIYKNAKAVKNSNPRAGNTLIVYDCYNQASAALHLADRVVTVSRNYMEEVSKELGFGFDFRDILKIRKNHRTFFGIVNGYDKSLISPNAQKIEHLNQYFEGFHFHVYDENSLDKKLENKKECIRLLSQIASSERYKNKYIPLIDINRFEDISDLISKADKVPFICATSRLVEQKGYDIAAKALVKVLENRSSPKNEYPIVVLGGAGDDSLFEVLKNLKSETAKISPKAARRIFVFRGYKDEFAYALQLAADFYLMPCRFEPCGLTQMEAMAKGALPIAMSTGGLVDTIEDGVDGFRTEVFFADGVRVYGSNLKAQKYKNNVNAYAECLWRALRCFNTMPKDIHHMTINAMHKDFGWTVPDGSVYKYLKLLQTGGL